MDLWHRCACSLRRKRTKVALYAVLSGRGGDPRGVWLSRQPDAPADPVFPSARGGRLGADAVPATRRSTHGDRMSGLRVAQREDRHTSHPAARRGHGAAPARRRPDGNRAVARATNQRSRQRCTCHADMRLKERALAHATASGLVPDRYRAPDPLLAFLDALSFFVAGLGIAELVADCAAWLASPRAGLLEETTVTSSHSRVLRRGVRG